MAKLPRIFQNLFGGNGDPAHFGQFGSRVETPPGFTTKDPASIQALTAFSRNGWLDAINTANKAAFLEDMNGIMFLIFYQICYGLKEGIPEWDASTEYETGGIVKKSGTTELYGSIIDGNTGNALPSKTANAFWNYLNPQSVPAGSIHAFGGPSAPFGYYSCDGTVLSQGAEPSLFAAIGPVWNTFNGNSDPGAGFFRVPDLRSLTLMGIGQGTGFSARALAQLVGEENHVLTVNELAPHGHPVVDGGHFHELRTNQVTAALTTGGGGGLPNGPGNGANGINTSTKGTGISVGNNGSGQGHNTMQPSAGVLWIIKS